jgi:hypothetical protein
MMLARPAESLHWYAQDGSPAYEVEAVKGGKRPTTLRDARKLGLVPSVTSIIRAAAAPGLERWKQEQVLLAALTLPKKPDEPELEYIARIIRDSQEQGKKAAARGTAIHAAIQGHYEGQPPDEQYWPHVKAAQMEISLRYGAVCEWIPEASFAHPLGFGGKCDLHAKIAEQVVIDFKTKEFKADDELKAWDEHAMQLAAYRVGLGIQSARGAIVYVSSTVPGLVRVVEINAAALDAGWEMFSSLLRYWQAKTGYRSAFETKVAA